MAVYDFLCGLPLSYCDIARVAHIEPQQGTAVLAFNLRWGHGLATFRASWRLRFRSKFLKIANHLNLQLGR